MLEQVRTCGKCGSNHMSRSCPRCGLETVLKEKKNRRPEDRMNATEARYAQRLEAERAIGTVREFRFEAMKFRLADDTFYTPDYMVVRPGGEIEFHEVKGPRIWDDSVVKFKVAAGENPLFGWKLVQWKGGVWTVLRWYEPGGPERKGAA